MHFVIHILYICVIYNIYFIYILIHFVFFATIRIGIQTILFIMTKTND